MRHRVALVISLLFPLSLWAQEAPENPEDQEETSQTEPQTEPASSPSAPMTQPAGAPEALQTPPPAQPAPALALQDTPAAPRKEPKSGISLALSAGGTALGVGVLALSADSLFSLRVNQAQVFSLLGAGILVVGPSAGQFYAGDKNQALLLSGVRLGSVGLLVIGGNLVVNGRTGGLFLSSIGTVTMASAILYDLLDAPFAATRVRRESARALKLSPGPVFSQNGNAAPGLLVSGSF